MASSALLAGAVASLDSGPVVWFELSSDADALSSQALSENAAAIPRTAAMALFLANETIVLSLTFFFSIFIFSSPNYTSISVLSKVEIMLNIIPPPVSGQRYTWPPMSTGEPPGLPWQASWISRMEGSLDDELAGLADSLEVSGCTASLEDSGVASELVGPDSELVGDSVALAGVGAAAELLDSAAADSASMTELLMGSWLRGMSTILLELLA